jgi:acetyl-CoA carboxylase biotin carboxyl carrier protein
MPSDPTDPKSPNLNPSGLPDLRYIRELAKMFKQYELDELEIETGDQRMLLRRGDVASASNGAGSPTIAVAPAPVAAPSVSPPAATPAREAEVQADFITSPFVGTFYRSSRPDAPSFVEVGAKVKPGQAVCIIEAMKLFNEIEADFACIIEEVLVENGQPVEYGANLFRVRKL